MLCCIIAPLFSNEVDGIKSKMQAIAAAKFDGTLDDYPAFIEKQGTDLLEQADHLLALTDISTEDKLFAVAIKELSIALRYGGEQDEYERKIEEWLETIKDIPEAKPRVRKIVQSLIGRERGAFWARSNSENVEPYREHINRFAPLINAHFEDAESNEQAASVMVSLADTYDPDGSAGLVLHAVEQLRPTLEAHRQRREFDLLRYCAESVLGIAHRIQMPGKELEFRSVDLKGSLVDVKDHRGKFVLLVFDASMGANREKISALKKLHAALQDDLVLIEYDTNHNVEITARRVEGLEIPWIVTSLGARHQQRDIKDYREVYGNRPTMLLADRNGIVLTTRGDGITPEVCEFLKAHFPDKAAILDEVATELQAVLDEQERQQEEFRRNRASAQIPDASPASQLQQILGKLFYASDSEGIGATVQRNLAEAILKSTDLHQEIRANISRNKVDAMRSIGHIELRRNPDKRPELVFAELLKYLEKTKEEAMETAFGRGTYSFTRLNILHAMNDYLKRYGNPVEYAQEIIDQFIAFIKEHESYTEYSSRLFVMFFQESLEGVDAKHSTQLLATFLGQVIPIFESSPDLETQQYARQLSGAERRGNLIGNELEFESVLIDGTTINVKDLRGKVVLVNFWATTCGPCRAKFPSMKELYEKYKPQGFEIIAYSCGDDDETLKAFVEREQHPWLVGSLLMSRRGGIKDYYEFYGIRGIPTTFLLDREGIVRFMMVGASDELLNREVEKLFGE
jgi:glutathione peroxidase-family protein